MNKSTICYQSFDKIELSHKWGAKEAGNNLSNSAPAKVLLMIRSKLGRRLDSIEESSLTLISVDPKVGEVKKFRSRTVLTENTFNQCCDKNYKAVLGDSGSPGLEVFNGGSSETSQTKKAIRKYQYEIRVYDDKELNRIGPAVGQVAIDRLVDQYNNSNVNLNPNFFRYRNGIVAEIKILESLINSRNWNALFSRLGKTKPLKSMYEEVRMQNDVEEITKTSSGEVAYTTRFFCKSTGELRTCCSSSSSSSSSSRECTDVLPDNWFTDDIDRKGLCWESIKSTIEGCDCVWRRDCQSAYEACLSSSSSSSRPTTSLSVFDFEDFESVLNELEIEKAFFNLKNK